MWPGPSREKAIMPGPDASVTNTCMPAIIRRSIPRMGLRRTATCGCFHKRMWCSK